MRCGQNLEEKKIKCFTSRNACHFLAFCSVRLGVKLSEAFQGTQSIEMFPPTFPCSREKPFPVLILSIVSNFQQNGTPSLVQLQEFWPNRKQAAPSSPECWDTSWVKCMCQRISSISFEDMHRMFWMDHRVASSHWNISELGNKCWACYRSSSDDLGLTEGSPSHKLPTARGGYGLW